MGSRATEGRKGLKDGRKGKGRNESRAISRRKGLKEGRKTEGVVKGPKKKEGKA